MERSRSRDIFLEVEYVRGIWMTVAGVAARSVREELAAELADLF